MSEKAQLLNLEMDSQRRQRYLNFVFRIAVCHSIIENFMFFYLWKIFVVDLLFDHKLMPWAGTKKYLHMKKNYGKKFMQNILKIIQIWLFLETAIFEEINGQCTHILIRLSQRIVSTIFFLEDKKFYSEKFQFFISNIWHWTIRGSKSI